MFDWNEYLTLAPELRLKQSEAALRSSISRAYYAAFCTALHRLHPSGSEVFSRDSHASLWQEYRRQGRAFSHIGVRGDRIRKDRQAVLQEAESIVAYLRECPAR